MSVPGVGPLISTAVVAAIGTGEAFDRGRDFGAWLGLVPRQYSTGGRSILGGISKRGSRYLRTLFIQAAKVLLMRPQNWRKLRPVAHQRRAAYAPQQAGHRPCQQTRSDRLERSEHREGFRHPSPTRDYLADLNTSSRLRHCMERIDTRAQSLAAQMVFQEPVR